MKKALITGVLGQDGRYLTNFLLDLDYKVVGVTRSIDSDSARTLQRKRPGIKLYEADICKPEDIFQILDHEKPDEVYNLAGFSSVRDSWKFPAEAELVNHFGFLQLIEAVKRFEGSSKQTIKVYQASSSEMFGNATESPQHEKTPFNPTSPYGQSKLSAHLAAERLRKNDGMFISSGVLFNHESPLRSPEFVTRKITMAVAKIAQGSRTKISLGNINSTRDWGFAGDYVIGMWKMLQVSNPDSYVLSTGISTSVQDFIAMSFDRIGIKDWERYVQIDPEEQRPIEPIHLVGNSRKANEELDWNPGVSIGQLVSMMIESDLRNERSLF